MTEVLSFDFDCPNKLRFDLSMVTGLVPTPRVSHVDDWFKVAHRSHESIESIVNVEETEVTYEDGRKGHISATLEIRDSEVFEPELEVA